MEESIKLLVGCYEQVLFGYRVHREGEQWLSSADFTHHAHTASVSVLAVNNRFVATGSRDETIQIYDMKKKVEHGALLHHNGTITCLEFYGNTHLLSGAEDGLICVWNTKKWECQQTFKAHKGQVLSLSIHPSGKLALSVGTDKTLRTWNLVEGRSAFIKNIKKNAHIVHWSPSGEKYVVVIHDTVDVYQLETAAVVGTINNPKRISSAQFITDALIAVAGDEEVIRLYDTASQKCVCEFKAHENRVKNLHVIELQGTHVVVSSSSDGYIKMWRIDMEKVQTSPSLLCEVSTSARLTCLSAWLPSGVDHKEKSNTAVTASAVKDCDRPKKKKAQNETTDKEASETQVVHKKRKPETKQKKKKPS
ncbi:p21-activated protein kinase-interacting protein 1-like [Xenopus laevis]|uniref:p21-activated protein kinase-interacting protein 1-like n=2 Tax=Xenopus laevis TaxID=8355 RepID=PK1IP_XENLA|nr:p21-activated protein kinase-interacting protein 1-like [Xenopus laevis]Q68FJ6.1 RecName: Full=p21-activated protein kinase-interacting protein 1-like; AltName: Full=PAK1-interacting protein 1-like [Xenopus laevis]AAH79760.1 MGC86205 protein [Xenopus laevis]